jgi:hypothetical protein
MATRPSAVAVVSSSTLIPGGKRFEGMFAGGAGDFGSVGMGKGTERMLYSNVEGSRGTMGKMVSSVLTSRARCR